MSGPPSSLGSEHREAWDDGQSREGESGVAVDGAGSMGDVVVAPFLGMVPSLAMVVVAQCCDEILACNHYKTH